MQRERQPSQASRTQYGARIRIGKAQSHLFHLFIHFRRFASCYHLRVRTKLWPNASISTKRTFVLGSNMRRLKRLNVCILMRMLTSFAAPGPAYVQQLQKARPCRP
jgi:hypothetical protein